MCLIINLPRKLHSIIDRNFSDDKFCTYVCNLKYIEFVQVSLPLDMSDTQKGNHPSLRFLRWSINFK